ncbi:hypothetical protein Q3G72_013207 [Acer saccharum]|nr:hypothetical protein Q3G72_013207 [Acer saccharum]
MKTRSVMESSNVVIDDCRLKTINHEEEVAIVDDSPLEKVVETPIDGRNKSDEYDNIVLNKARLVAQGYSQIEGIDFDETFTLVTRLESIRLLLSISSVHKFKLHQMDVKSAFFNGFLQEEVFVE